MQSIILAAGMGSRLGALTAENTKCMVKVNEVTLIERLLSQLEDLKLSRIVIVTGYKGKKLQDYIKTLGIKTEIVFVDNPIYDKTNNIYSLYLARNYLLSEDTMLFESDIIFDDKIIKSLYADKRESLAVVAQYESWMDGTVVRLSDDDEILDVIPGKDFDYSQKEHYFKTVNVYKFSKTYSTQFYVPFLEAYIHAVGNNVYYENVLRILTMLDNTGIHAMRLNGEKWYEIDDIQDLEIASSLFADTELQAKMFQHAYGGYWRYPRLLDFCYLVNPYYPQVKMIEEMKASFEMLLTQYPSGMERNSLLAAKNFGVEQNHIVIGNGAAELIKSLLSYLSETEKCGFIRPTFEEYPNRCKKENEVIMNVSYPDFSYTADDVISYFSEHKVSSLFLINPDNPSGNYISRENILKIADWAEKKNIRLVVDESFADFSDEERNSIIEEEVLQTYPHLIVVKSISKSYGVPGLRLGVLTSFDTDLISFLKKDVAIWNINSFAEFYMQIAGKYKKDYVAAIKKYRAERNRFISCLKTIHYLRVIPTQANFVMCEVIGKKSKELTEKLLSEKEIFIKDLTPKINDGKQYIRLAIRNEADNDRIIEAFKAF
ncbi:MAG: aminotransferase class I/II-fold pyridoxal phosphate-dependent enzyme [Spirochaetia bacterium]|nr:aminotransferase class I/II-fold pyridoxal phosphate-dependent enzyme [Spirochaetia bacterium]MDD7769294.1 aminotransferase class I/II-fold pyridoxal phosphate-dependent enzyme [Treponema sp.]